MDAINSKLPNHPPDADLVSLLSMAAYMINELKSADLKYARYMAQMLYYELDERLAVRSMRE